MHVNRIQKVPESDIWLAKSFLPNMTERDPEPPKERAVESRVLHDESWKTQKEQHSQPPL